MMNLVYLLIDFSVTPLFFSTKWLHLAVYLHRVLWIFVELYHTHIRVDLDPLRLLVLRDKYIHNLQGNSFQISL